MQDEQCQQILNSLDLGLMVQVKFTNVKFLIPLTSIQNIQLFDGDAF